ncbi:hypothetical protein ACH5RR_009723 [Cinchona calisaya]|uniref:AB hydrolase-1 domain-containing protein n=1 Tax=Cinchona calisaya TaxID=153742 RepID=A0ABD3AF02_9GENT
MAEGPRIKKISAASARAHTRRSNNNRASFKVSSKMIAQVAVGLVASFLVWAYLSIKPAPPKVCGSPGGPPVTSPRIKLRDGRYLAYKESGVSKEEAKYKIILVHGFDSSKDLSLPISQDLIKERQIYFLSFDRAGYGESDPHPARSVKSEAYDIQELADQLHIGPKFHIVGISMGAYPIWSCLRYIPHRLSGVALVVPFVHYWWRCLPAELSQQSLKKLLVQDQRTFQVAHYTPWLFNWWMTQKWFRSLSIMEGNMDIFCSQDLEIVKQLSSGPNIGQEKIRQQGLYESLFRDILAGYAKWEFDPTDIVDPFPNKDGSVHIWQGYEDRIIPLEINRFILKKLPWIRYHEVPDAGHLLIFNASLCEAVFRELLNP